MPYATDDIIHRLRLAREQAGLSQRELSARIGVPQSHISKIESGATDLRLSSLVELARALDFELVLVPRKLLPVVEAIVSNASATFFDQAHQHAVFSRAQAGLAKLSAAYPDVIEIKRLDQVLRELAHLQLDKSYLDTVSALTDKFLSRAASAVVPVAIERVTRQLTAIRNKIVHAPPEAPRPAYQLGEDDDDA